MNILNIGSFVSMAQIMQLLTFFLIISKKYRSIYLYKFFETQGIFFFSFLDTPYEKYIPANYTNPNFT